MPIIEAALATGATVRFTATGSSMFPFLRHGEVVELASCPTHRLRPGDVVLARRPDGHYVMHRIMVVEPGRVYMVSDAGRQDGWIPAANILARAIAVERKGRWHRLDTGRARRAGLLWRRFRHVGPPALAVAMKVRSRILRKRAKPGCDGQPA